MDWEASKSGQEARAKVFGGWVLKCYEKFDRGSSWEWDVKILFLPDPQHEWDWSEVEK